MANFMFYICILPQLKKLIMQCTKIHLIVHFKWVTCVPREPYLNSAVMNKSVRRYLCIAITMKMTLNFGGHVKLYIYDFLKVTLFGVEGRCLKCELLLHCYFCFIIKQPFMYLFPYSVVPFLKGGTLWCFLAGCLAHFGYSVNIELN